MKISCTAVNIAGIFAIENLVAVLTVDQKGNAAGFIILVMVVTEKLVDMVTTCVPGV